MADLSSVQTSNCIIKEAGIDWVTLTTTQEASQLEYARYFNDVAGDDLRNGYKVVPGGQFGFYGERARHAFVGYAKERMILQVSGRRAQRAVMLCRQGDNCSRLDVQITLDLGGQNVSEWLDKQYETARTTHTGRGKPPKCKKITGEDGVETVYIGRRTSDIYVRLYNKFTESKDEAHRGCVRMEVEYKGKASKALWAHMAKEALGTMFLLQQLLAVLERKGVEVAMVDIERQDISVPKQEHSKQYVSLGWLATQVAPTVARLVGDLSFFTVFHAVFGKALTEHDFTMIMNAASLSWGC